MSAVERSRSACLEVGGYARFWSTQPLCSLDFLSWGNFQLCLLKRGVNDDPSGV